jgi:hypothetical protein
VGYSETDKYSIAIEDGFKYDFKDELKLEFKLQYKFEFEHQEVLGLVVLFLRRGIAGGKFPAMSDFAPLSHYYIN